MVAKIAEISAPDVLNPDTVSDRDDFLTTVFKHKNKKEKSRVGDDVPNVYAQQTISALNEKPLSLRMGHGVVRHEMSGRVGAAIARLPIDEVTTAKPVGQHKAWQVALVGKHPAADNEVIRSGRSPVGKTREGNAGIGGATHNAADAQAEMPADQYRSLLKPTRSHENTPQVLAPTGQVRHLMHDVTPSHDMTSPHRGKAAMNRALSATQQERQRFLGQPVTADSQTLRLSYPFQQWSGTHHVSIALHRHSQQESRVTLLPSDARTADALQRQMDDWPACLPDVVDQARGDREREGRQQQDGQEEEQE